MSTINEHNLDELLFDYLEGNLSSEKAVELESFLKAHPEHAAELEAWKATYVQEPAKVAVYPGAQSLIQPVNGLAGFGGLGLGGWGIVSLIVLAGATLLYWGMQPSPKGDGQELNESDAVAMQMDTVADVVTLSDTNPAPNQPDSFLIDPELLSIDFSPTPHYGLGAPDRMPYHGHSAFSLNEARIWPEIDSLPGLTLSGSDPDTTDVPSDSLAPPEATAVSEVRDTIVQQPKVILSEKEMRKLRREKKRLQRIQKRGKPVNVVPLKSDAF